MKKYKTGNQEEFNGYGTNISCKKHKAIIVYNN